MNAIELLEERIAISKVSADNENYLIQLTIGEAENVVAFFKQPKEQSEFTKALRKNVQEFPNFPEHLQDLFRADIIEACKLIDEAKAENKALQRRAEAAEEDWQICEAKLKEQANNMCDEENSMLECWLVHPEDDDDCLECPSIKDCREVRKYTEKLEIEQAQLKEQAAEIERLKELAKGATYDYGYANGWGDWEPLLVKECKDKGHKTNDRNAGRMFDNIVWCDECKYKYKYDSS